ncbi:MAG: translesion error-prone DNA polymerase V autoproteolytic subunit [Sinobacteraceae bacterium]|nr:translesion error-prone DNA polymerase V autoproteolytic subunit [Nevskiaceae bacterium]
MIPAVPAPPRVPLPYFESPRPQAGFPSPAMDYIERPLDLNDLLVNNPPATFYVRAQGDSMEGARIFDGDLLVVDRSIDPAPGRIVVAAVDGELLVKRLGRSLNRPALLPDNPARPEYRPVLLDADSVVWGVVTGVVRRL